MLVRAGARVPADGRIIDGEAELDESMITGESRPVTKTVGDRVVAGTVSTDSSIRVEVDAVGEDTALAGIQRLVADAQASGSRAQVLADRFAALLFYVAAGAAAVTFVAWSLAGDMQRGDRDHRDRARHRLPARARPGDPARDRAVHRGRRQARHPRQGSPRARADAHRRRRPVRQDGHAHEGQPRRHRRRAVSTSPDAEILALAAAVEAESEHPLAKAIVARARENGAIPEATGFRSLTGRGVEATVDGIGTRGRWTGTAARTRADRARRRSRAGPRSGSARGASVLYLVEGGRIIGALALEDEVRPEARQAVAELHALGVELVVMITGDARQVAERVAAEVGIDEVFAEVLPGGQGLGGRRVAAAWSDGRHGR